MPKYIDADALRKRMEQIAEESKPAATARPMREDTPSELLRYGTARAMIEWLDEIPAADVEPVRHGRWILYGEGYDCSECKKWVDGDIRYSFEDRTPFLPVYCPFCGAKMDKEET